jgi:hypothetical protein
MKTRALVSTAKAVLLLAFLLLMFGAVWTPAASSAHFDGQISVDPNMGLVDGQVVQVSGSAFQKDRELRIVECGPTSQTRPPVSAICSSYSVEVTTDGNGNFPAQGFTVSTTVVGTRFEQGHQVPATYDCLVANDCHIHVFAPAKGSASANEDIFFSE